ncbi:MAG TPA: hypothetical protein VHH15_08280 [Actinophytocola sp.]|nr:hypothetical protein [Actinophytocola sp.]
MRLLVVVIAVLGLAGCTGSRVSGVPIGSTLAPPTSSTVVTTTDPPPAEPTFPKAADGKNLAACADGVCEVEVRAPVELAFDPAVGITRMTIHTIGPEGMHITGSAAGGGTFTVDLYADPGTVARGVINNALSITTLATQDGRALLTLARV